MATRCSASVTGEPFLFKVRRHAFHDRLRHIEIDQAALARFLGKSARIDIQNLQYVPFMRFMLAKILSEAVGPGLAEMVHEIVQDRATGGFTTGVQHLSDNPDDFVRFGTAVAHLLGPSNHDSMSGTFFARFLVEDTDASDSYLRQAYRTFTLHTDGTFVDEATDWLLMMKFHERSARGGESRLLHLDDWEQHQQFLTHPLATQPILYRAAGSKNVDSETQRPVFFDSRFGRSISFIDQFAQPRNLTEASYLHDLSRSMERSTATKEVPLPVGDLIVLNNHFWLHGRASFEKDPKLSRELMRQRGRLQA